MADLYILIPETEAADPLFAWRVAGEWQVDTACPRGHGRGDGAVAFVPATAITCHQADITARKPAEARRVALFSLEDDLAEPVEQLHAAIAPPRESARRAVHIAAVRDMDRWTGWLDRQGLPDAALVAPQGCLPAGTAFEGPEHILFRTSDALFAIDADAPDDLVKSLAPDGLEAVHGERLARIVGVAEAGPGAPDRPTYLAQLAAWAQATDAADLVFLRQGDFAVRRQLQLDGLSRWRPLAAVAGAALVLWLGTVWMETRALNKQTQALRAQTNELASAIAPDASQGLSQTMEELRQNQRLASSSLRPTQASAALYEAIAPVGDAEIRSLRYDAGAGRLTAMVVFGSYGDADAIGQRLEEKGLSVRLGEARQTGSRVMGEFSIEAAS